MAGKVACISQSKNVTKPSNKHFTDCINLHGFKNIYRFLNYFEYINIDTNDIWMIQYILFYTHKIISTVCALGVFQRQLGISSSIIVPHIRSLHRIPNILNKIAHKRYVDYLHIRDLLYFSFSKHYIKYTTHGAIDNTC